MRIDANVTVSEYVGYPRNNVNRCMSVISKKMKPNPIDAKYNAEPPPDRSDGNEREQQEDRRENDRDHQEQEQHPFSERDLGVAAPDRMAEVADDVAVRREVPEEGCVVGDGPDVVGVRVVPGSQLGARDRGEVAHRLTLDRVARRVPELCSGDGAETRDHAVDLSRRERRLLHEHRRERRRSFGRCRDDEDVAGGIADAALGERLARGGDVTGRAVRPGVVVELAELGRQDPTAVEVVEAVGDRLARVQVAL
jgi:hypothetical protein